MASPEFHAYQQQMAARPAGPPAASIQEVRDRIDAAMGKLPLAEGTSAYEVDANGVPAIMCERTDHADAPLVVYFHGGGYRIASALAYRAFGSHLAAACHARVLVVDYRLAPEERFPAAVTDAVTAYRWALHIGTAPASIVIGGDSAGGGLCAALLLAARAEGLPLPAGGVCLSPWADLTNSAATFETRKATDTMFSLNSATEAAGMYLAGHDAADPLASPVFGNWAGMPPLLILVGDTEVLLDDAAKLASVAQAAGGDVEHSVYPEMPHVWMTSYPAFPEAVQAVEQIAAFVRRVAS